MFLIEHTALRNIADQKDRLSAEDAAELQNEMISTFK